MSSNCTGVFVGDGDLYGLGVRIGLYAQILAFRISSVLFRGRPHGSQMRTTSLWFQYPLMFTLTVKSTSSTSIHPVEAYIVLLLVLAFPLWAGGLPGFSWLDFRAEVFQEGLASSPLTLRDMAAQHALGAWMLTFNLWFWWLGMDIMFTTLEGGVVNAGNLAACPQKSKLAFFFVAVEIDGWFQTLNRVHSTFILIVISWTVTPLLAMTGIFALKEAGRLLAGTIKSPRHLGRGLGAYTVKALDLLLAEPSKPAASQTRRTVGLYDDFFRRKVSPTFDKAFKLRTTGSGRVSRAFTFPFFQLLWLVWIAVSVESMIVWNSIKGVSDLTGSGQVIAMIIGLGNLGQTLIAMYNKVREIIKNPGTYVFLLSN
ncbi:hypothetical protein BJ508DRAFT_85921 [Ascobolus immersus RN42]|uniref:Uncharacterized protein n=1 Tax=Ascobolus immersus RN42 TaxID=1160509 RepID=A0A3N4I916_ASCIM|nr:hypothetical protein BJ508DRAFT_85921 [Ascobolus immersus RN42]